MDQASQKGLESLDREALVALIRAQEQEREKVSAILRAQQEQLRRQEEEVRKLEAQLESQLEQLSAQGEQLRDRSERIEHLKLMVEKYRHMIFGKKSEKIVVKLEQLEFELEEDETTQAEAEAISERVSPGKAPKPRCERKPLPEHLKREEVMHKPDTDCCPDCGGGLRHFGNDVSEQLEYVPESFKVIRHVRPKFACTGCDRVVEAPAPSRPIERGLAAPSLLAHVIVSKYADYVGLPVM